MNLSKLFEAQRELDDYIEQQHPVQPGEDRLSKKILALLVELGECANEFRGFKFWSNDRKPRTVLHTWIDGIGKVIKSMSEPLGSKQKINCYRIKNPLLEEYVDCLHFMLSIGNDIDCDVSRDYNALKVTDSDITKQLITLFSYTTKISHNVSFLESHRSEEQISKWTEDALQNSYVVTVGAFLGLGEMLGFTETQIEQAYWEKYKINKQRQQNGY
ncbi:dUTP diphosphatase [Viridibacillus sp. NPDC096237]|uniref:dUTP diphosphatase n=1 Tax=Viridibacillus sp. NPDC096237 TaxID=3390721 RepID=UPI003CFE9E97